MKPFNHHQNAATDRMRASLFSTGRRVLAILMASLIALPMIMPVFSIAGQDAEYERITPPSEDNTTDLVADIPQVESSLLAENAILTPALPESVTIGLPLPQEITAGDPTEDTAAPSDEPTDTEASEPFPDLSDPDAPLTQELIAQRIEARMQKQVRGGSRIYYPYPAGAMAVDLYKDGKQILKGQVADIGGTVYVPVQRFADLFGSFQTTYIQSTEEVIIKGKNLSISVRVGDPHITVNERIFYTGNSQKVISLGGWIFVPLTSMCKALNASVNIRKGYYDAFITSGDPAKVPWASEYYNETDLYWLSRIISAEARGEPFAGQIAVGNVVLNRMRSSQFPNTVKGVIFDRKYGTQFSPVASGTIYNTPTASAIRAAKICLEGYSLSTKMIYFYNPSIATSSWIGQTRPYVMTIGNHKFYA